MKNNEKEFYKRFVIHHEGGWVGLGEVQEPYDEMKENINPQDIAEFIKTALQERDKEIIKEIEEIDTCHDYGVASDAMDSLQKEIINKIKNL